MTCTVAAVLVSVCFMKIINSIVYWQNIYHIQHVLMADSYLQASAHSALGAAEIAASRKEAK